MFSNILKSRNNAKPKILDLHLFWARDFQYIALFFSDFLSYLFIFYPFVYTYLFMYVCFCMWVSVVCHCTRGAQSTTFQSFFLFPLCVGQRLNSVSAEAASVLIHWADPLADPCLSSEGNNWQQQRRAVEFLSLLAVYVNMCDSHTALLR